MSQKHQNNKALLDIEKVLKILPHRYPFLLVDRILDLKEGKSIVAIKNVTFNEHFFQGHFPDFRVMPGVLVVEAIAQTGAILLYSSIPNPESILVFLSKLDNTKFRKPIIPGDQLKLEVKIARLKNKFCQIAGTASVDGEIMVECEAMASFVSLEELNERE